MSRVVVAMSGGVDSSVAALLLKEAGHEVIGITLRLWPEAEAATHRHPCCLSQDVDDARWVCHTLGIPYYVLNFQREFEADVVAPFVAEYARGRTPNPCLACNQVIKFRYLLRRALALGADYLATGHYARIARCGEEYQLLRGLDPAKDQSYVLYMLGQQELAQLLFPVGGLHKGEVRRLAAQRGLPVASKHDSQEICFLPDGDYRPFLAQYINPQPGEIVDLGGRFLGYHDGIAFYTVGQRRGLGACSSHPLYVARIEPQANRLVVGGEDALYARQLQAGSVHWVSGNPPSSGTGVTAKIRYRCADAPATLWPNGDGMKVEFQQPQRAIAPGQAVVLYDGEKVLGGGTIESAGQEG